MATIKVLLSGHTSPATAYTVDDYPYGFRLRCKIRYWLEYTPKRGVRLWSQTTNPKRPGEVWNKPNTHGWTPLTIAEGYRFGNFKPSPPTVQAFLEVMKAAGIQPAAADKNGISDYIKH